MRWRAHPSRPCREAGRVAVRSAANEQRRQGIRQRDRLQPEILEARAPRPPEGDLGRAGHEQDGHDGREHGEPPWQPHGHHARRPGATSRQSGARSITAGRRMRRRRPENPLWKAGPVAGMRADLASMTEATPPLRPADGASRAGAGRRPGPERKCSGLGGDLAASASCVERRLVRSAPASPQGGERVLEGKNTANGESACGTADFGSFARGHGTIWPASRPLGPRCPRHH